MGILKKVKIWRGVKRALLGVTDAIGISSILKANIDSQHITDDQGNTTGTGKIDYIRLVVAICTIIGLIALIKGWIDKETFKEILKMLN